MYQEQWQDREGQIQTTLVKEQGDEICGCGAIIPEGAELTRCDFCEDIICPDCESQKNWNGTGWGICNLEKCEAKAVKALAEEYRNQVDEIADLKLSRDTHKTISADLITLLEQAMTPNANMRDIAYRLGVQSIRHDFAG